MVDEVKIEQRPVQQFVRELRQGKLRLRMFATDIRPAYTVILVVVFANGLDGDIHEVREVASVSR